MATDIDNVTLGSDGDGGGLLSFGVFDTNTTLGYFGSLTTLLCATFCLMLILFDLYMNFFRFRSRVLVQSEKNKKQKKDLPSILPYDDYLYSLGRFIYLLFFNREKVRDIAYLHEQNMKFDSKHDNLMCRQAVFLFIPAIFTWDPDHYKIITQEPGPFKKMMGLSKFFTSQSEKSILFVEGEEWQDQHRLIAPAFQTSHLYEQVPKFNYVGKRLVGELKKVCDQPIEAIPWMSKATLDGLSIAGFGVDMEALLGGHSEGYKLYTASMKGLVDPLRSIPILEDLPLKRNKEFRETFTNYMKFLEEIVEEKREKRRKAKEKGELEEEEFGGGRDILDILVGARDVEGGNGLTDRELIHNVNIFFIAGHESSSSTLSFCLHVLEQYPEYQKKLRDEINEIIGDRDPTKEDIKSLKLLPCFVEEVMRLYPAFAGVLRVAREDTVLGDYQIKEGDLVMFCTYTAMRHPQLWDEPDRFWPERFYVENSKGRHPLAYTPFSSGPRSCIGNNFALIEMKILLIHMLKSFEVLPDPNTPVPFNSFVGATLRPVCGTTLLLKPLSSS